MIRLVHIITGLDTGGAEMMLFKLLTHTDRSQFEVSVVSLTEIGPIGEKIQALGIEVWALGMRAGLPDPRAVLRLSRYLKSKRPDVVQTWMYHADLIGGLGALLAGVRRVAWNLRTSNLDPVHSKRTTILTAKACARLSRRVPSRIVCCSESAREVHTVVGYDSRKMLVIPNGFDLDAYRPDLAAPGALRAELGLHGDTPIIGQVGRFDPQKDYRTWAQAAGILHRTDSSVRFVLCGSKLTTDNAELLGWIREAGIESVCHLLGRRSDIPQITPGFTIASSSSAYGEGFPNVVGEAMACGVPCAVTDVGDSALIVGDTGEVVPHSNPEALAAAWKRMLDAGPSARSELGQRARKRVEDNFNLPDIALRYASLYREMIGS